MKAIEEPEGFVSFIKQIIANKNVMYFILYLQPFQLQFLYLKGF